MPKHLRPHIAAFRDFARTGDEIADDPELDLDAKLICLDALDKALTKGETGEAFVRPALDLRRSLAATGVGDAQARQMIEGFRRDAQTGNYQTWGDLLTHCRFSAIPVGRHMMALHGESEAPGVAFDALCSALQILTIVQECRNDWVVRGRCYIPLTWFNQLRVSPERLVETRCDPRLRAVFDRTLDRVDALLVRSAPLPQLIAHRGLRLQVSVLLATAQALTHHLRHRDPLAGAVRLPLPQRLWASLRGLIMGLRR
ncbi:MAG: squalene/phytoene synthase family protein [Azospirillaceae bacterium]|nr:squalene/phytoene synthase family protein [Azospirillaceae bacterium]